MRKQEYLKRKTAGSSGTVKKWLFLFVFCALPSLMNVLSAQQQTSKAVTGTVIDEQGESVIGASVVEKGTVNGTATDIDGNFFLQVKNGATLVISFIGYSTQEIKVKDASHYSITLKEDAQLLEEVVVVAYGQQRKVSVTGAISTIQTRDLKQSPAANLSASLAGRLPGLAAIQTTGRPGAGNAVALYLRGIGTTNGANPLIMIDGVPRDDINLLSTLDPNEIASVSILKDASATAVFGVKGANGAILITTRRGKTGKAELSISADYSLQQFTVMPEHLHSYTYAELQNEAARNSGGDLPFTDYMIRKYRDGSDPIFYPDRDLIKEFYNSAAPQLRLNANMSGGTEALRYFVNVGYIGQGSNFKTVYNKKYDFDPAFKMDRYNFRGNLDFDATKNLKISLNLASYLQKANAPNFYKVGFGDVDAMTEEVLSFIMGADPTQPGPLTVGGTTTPDGTPVPAGLPTLQMPSSRSAYGVLNGYGYSWESRATLNSSLVLEWKLPFITQGLSAKALIAYDSEGYEYSDGSLVVNYVQFQIGREEGEKSHYIMPNVDRFDPLALYKSSSGKYYADIQLSLNYDRMFGKHAVTGMVLAQRENHDDWDGTEPFNVLGLLGRFTYAYADRYLAEINMGYNGTEQFAPSNRFGFFPAFSAGWVISNEPFVKGDDLLSNLKLRASYGKVGNDKLTKNGEELRFIYLDDIQSAGGGLPSLGRTGGSSISYALYGNPNLQWEEAWKQNYGFDLQLWGALSLTADVFFEDRSKILINRESIPEILGVPNSILPPMNMNRVKNRGFELELAYQKIFNKDLSVNARANFGFNRNKIIEADKPMLSEDYYYRYRKTGFPIDQPFGYVIDYSNGNGYINTQEELDNLPTYNIGGDPHLGDFIYKNMNGDEVIDSKDQVPLGYSGVPEITYGWSMATNWKNFDVSFLLQGIAHVSMAYPGFRWNEPDLQHAWTKERYESGEEIRYPALSLTNTGPSYTTNSFFLLDRSFLRLKTAEIGYTLPTDRTKKIGISRMRVYVNGNNLLTFTPMKAQYNDPEQDSWAKFPLAKMVNFGINLVF